MANVISFCRVTHVLHAYELFGPMQISLTKMIGVKLTFKSNINYIIFHFLNRWNTHYVNEEFVSFQRSVIFVLPWAGHSEVCRDFSGRVCGFFGWFTQFVLVLPQGNQTIYWIHPKQHHYISRKSFWFVSGFYFLLIINWLLPYIYFILLLYCGIIIVRRV